MKRTCLITKTVAGPETLLRFTVVSGQLVFDGSVKAPGRGGYVVKDANAIDKLGKMAGKIAYFLKVKKVEVGEEEIERGKSFLN